jgi:AcrR family transcriptional regulator
MSRWPARETMEQRILATADRLFYGAGIRAVGVDTIAAEVGISKRTLYNHFASKDALIVAYLSQRLVPPEASSATPIEQIIGAFDRLEDSFARKGWRGCAFANAVAELADPAHPASKLAIAFKEQRRAWFRDLLRGAGAQDPEGLSLQLALLWEGAIAAAQVRRDPSVAGAAAAAARVLLEAAGAAKPRPRRALRR